jgi:hypothetical protein
MSQDNNDKNYLMPTFDRVRKKFLKRADESCLNTERDSKQGIGMFSSSDMDLHNSQGNVVDSDADDLNHLNYSLGNIFFEVLEFF